VVKSNWYNNFMTSIAEILGPEKVEELTSIQFETSESIQPKRDKYEPYKEILETNNGLCEQIQRVFSHSHIVPAVHITSSAFKNEMGEVTSGFLDNIAANGFRAKDTNVGVFMKREGLREPAIPVNFVERPEKFLRELETIIRHYYHHGVRTNKALLRDSRNIGTGVPVMLLIDTSNIDLERGSDYEDHYKLGTSASISRIVGEIDLEGIGTEIREKLPEIATKFLELTESYLDKTSQHPPR